MTGSLPSQDIFTRISDASEKARLFFDLAKARGDLVAKRPEPSADVFVLMAFNYANEKLQCKLTGASASLPPQGSLILTTFIGGEKYFVQTDYQCAGDTIILFTTKPIFHLQRREDYRVRIPISYKALLEIVSINGQTRKTAIPLMDLSGGGCRIQVDPKFLGLKVHDEIKGHIFLPDRSPIPVLGSIRHVRLENHGKGPLICGIQFVALTEPLKNRIIAVVMDLYRELFAGRT